MAVVVLCGVASSATAFAQTRKVDVCHASGGGVFSELNISRNALPAHLAHGDGVAGDAVPGMSGYEFDDACAVVLAQPNFVVFEIRNSNGSISPPWDSDISVVENLQGDGFAAVTPRGGQKVGYGTSFFDSRPINTIDTVNWVQQSGAANLVSYLNIWVTDGTNYAIIASENDYRGQPFATRQEWKVFEYDSSVSLDWLCDNVAGARDGQQYLTCGGQRATLADIPSNVVIQSPILNPAPSYVGTGAPRAGYGFNLIFGDTQSNFIGSYHLRSLSITVAGITYFAID